MSFAEFKYYGDCAIAVDGETFTDINNVKVVDAKGKTWTDTVSASKGFTIIKVPNRGRYRVDGYNGGTLKYSVYVTCGFGQFVPVNFYTSELQKMEGWLKDGSIRDHIQIGDEILLSNESGTATYGTNAFVAHIDDGSKKIIFTTGKVVALTNVTSISQLSTELNSAFSIPVEWASKIDNGLLFVPSLAEYRQYSLYTFPWNIFPSTAIMDRNQQITLNIRERVSGGWGKFIVDSNYNRIIYASNNANNNGIYVPHFSITVS